MIDIFYLFGDDCIVGCDVFREVILWVIDFVVGILFCWCNDC